MVNQIVVGADEAGRGLIIGPMVIGACAVNEDILNLFKKIGIKDSKKYTSQNKLNLHVEKIKKESLAWSVKILQADVLNNFNKNRMTMDEAEAFTFYRALEEIQKKISDIKEFQVDNFQAVNKLKSLMKQNSRMKEIKLIVLPKAESKYLAVSAGSLLARSSSLNELDKIRKKYGDFGSGSTNDKLTINWLKKYYEKNASWPEEIVRVYWKTIDKIEKEINKKRAKT
ncbi:MAG: ribonuclease HII [Asgard group archaeon]|nr:ribonuclease HII [Asgard group archaeon]